MSRLVSRAESWDRVYTAFQNVNFAAFDYNTVKQSLIHYIKLYFPETFNDYIESSEFIAIIETFAYISELIAYRLDTNAQEVFISTAQRRESILRLAKLISYKADRALPARGLVKITSAMTTETVIDANGVNLANTAVRWNDTNNTEWKQQFVLIMNRVLAQPFGTVRPTDRFQIQDVVFELYRWNLIPVPQGVFSYGTSVGGTSVSMELVPVEHDDSLGIIERRPQNNSDFSFLYGTDGLGDSSDTTGFFCFTKQGTLQRFRTTFDGITPNQTYDVNATNVNEIDVWLNNVNPDTGVTLDEPALLPYKRASDIPSGEWQQVDLAHAQNVIFNTNPARNKYEIETLTDDRIRLIFGDGEFADIPSGTFDIWTRASLDQDLSIPRSAVANIPATFTYTDAFGRVQTFTFTVSLINSLQNASARETIEHIRVTAPAVYFTQDRMVNAEDYNIFPLQDSTILKLRSINRTFAGDSKYIAWHDPRENYENVKIFSDDGYLYFDDNLTGTLTPSVNINTLIETYIQPLLSSTDIFMQLVSNGVDVADIRRIFNQDELDRIAAALTAPPSPVSAELYYNKVLNEWFAVKESADPANAGTPPLYVDGLGGAGWNASPALNDFIPYALIFAEQINIVDNIYRVSRLGRRTIVESVTTRFWNTNNANTVVDYDTLNSVNDDVIILKANLNNNRNGVLTQNWEFDVLGQETIESGPDLGLTDIHRLSVISADQNGDHVPDNPNLLELINPVFTLTAGYQEITFTTPISGADLPYTVATTYTATLTIDGVATPVSMPVVTPLTFTFSSLVAAVNAALPVAPAPGAGHIQLFQGGLLVTSATYDTTSTVAITQPGGGPFIFGSIVNPGPGTIGTAVVGSSTAPHTGTVLTVPSDYITGQGDVSVSGDLTGMVNTSDWNEGSLIANEIVNTVDVFDMNGNIEVSVSVKDYVYFSRLTITEPWVPTETTPQSMSLFIEDMLAGSDLWRRNNGRNNFNFAWFHRSTRYHLVDPAASNIIDTYVITKGYYTSLKRALENNETLPSVPTPQDLRTSYNYLLDNKMISDTVILHGGLIRLLFGPNAAPELQATLKVIRAENGVLTDNQVKTTIVTTIRNFFDITTWEFGETFFFTEMAAAIHAALPTEIRSVVLVPTFTTNQFGDMFEVLCREDEIFYADISVNNVEIVPAYNAVNLRLNG